MVRACGDVCSPSINRANMTVKNGALLLMVSVNETATYLSETRPSTTVSTRITPTTAMSVRNERRVCARGAESVGSPSYSY